MSAIWGILDLDGGEITEKQCSLMTEPFRMKKIDRIQSICQNHVFLACGLQFVNKEAEKECYPYEIEGNLLVADAILDNRSALQEQFHTQNSLSHKGIDGSILAECVQNNLDAALDAMLGAYVFAHYSSSNHMLTIANDVMGTRSVYYMVQNHRIYFSSLLESLLAFQEKPRPNDSWLLSFLAENSLRFVSEARETPYLGIFRLEPGEKITFSKEGLTREAYWNPLKDRKTMRLPDHDAYAKRLCEVFSLAVESTIRGDRDEGILLSGGLDSNAVAAYAAPKLGRLGKKLYSFTSVPDAERPEKITADYYVSDERTYIEKVRQKHPNLIPEWIGCRQFDYLKANRACMAALEIPYKTIPNMPWMARAYQRAGEKGCGILLTGQYGNITISFGNYENLFDTLLKHGRFLELRRQVNAYRKKYPTGRRKIYKVILKSLRPTGNNYYCREELNPEVFRTQKEVLKRLHTPKRICKDALENMWPYMYDKVALRQVGESEMKLSLETGVIPRDPTRDKRLIQLVLSLPVEEFVYNGIDRRLVREDLADLIPREITGDIYHRGEQAVGAKQNLRTNWADIKEELRKEFETGHAERFLNLPYLIRQLDDPEITEEESYVQMVRLIYCGLCSEFIGSNYDKSTLL